MNRPYQLDTITKNPLLAILRTRGGKGVGPHYSQTASGLPFLENVMRED